VQAIWLISIVLQGESCKNDTIWAQKPKSSKSSQKKVIKVCVDDYLAQWHENQKKLALL
jgi:hypothetical protein